MTKAMGFNGARKHQKVEDPRFLYWADKMGFLVSGEMANAYEFDERNTWRDSPGMDGRRGCATTITPRSSSGSPSTRAGACRILRDPRQQRTCGPLYHADASHSIRRGW